MSVGVAVVVTLLNEARALPQLLGSLLAQTRPPQEIILVDGGSRDRSCEIIQEYIEKGAPIRLIALEKANRSRGRNAGIQASSQPIIAVTDAGCRPALDWLERIVAPLEKGDAEVASGYYRPEAETLIEHAIAAATVPLACEVNPETFLPSSRSAAFLKAAWEQAEGYPESNSNSEDTDFDVALKRQGFKFQFVPEAIVFWRVQGRLCKLFYQFYRYARGDGAAGLLFGHYKKAFLLTLWFSLLFLLILLSWKLLPAADFHLIGIFLLTLLAYAGKYILRARKRGWDWPAALLSPLALAVVDAAHCCGYVVGWLDKARK